MTGDALHVLENVIIAAMGASTVIFVAYSPIARAIGNRILHGKLPPPGTPVRDDARVDQISGEVAALRQHLEETLDRLDFAERIIAQARDRGALSAGKDG